MLEMLETLKHSYLLQKRLENSLAFPSNSSKMQAHSLFHSGQKPQCLTLPSCSRRTKSTGAANSDQHQNRKTGTAAGIYKNTIWSSLLQKSALKINI